MSLERDLKFEQLSNLKRHYNIDMEIVSRIDFCSSCYLFCSLSISVQSLMKVLITSYFATLQSCSCILIQSVHGPSVRNL